MLRAAAAASPTSRCCCRPLEPTSPRGKSTKIHGTLPLTRHARLTTCCHAFYKSATWRWRHAECRCSAKDPKVSPLSPEPGPGQRSALDPAHTHRPPLIYHHCAAWQVIFLCRRHQALFYAQRQHPGKIRTANSLTRAAGARCSQVQQQMLQQMQLAAGG